jgi:ketosteroid isomerase-like protein
MLSAQDHLAIEALHDEWLKAELLGNSSALLKLCTPFSVWLPPNEAPLCGQAAILHWLAAQPQATVRRIDIADLAIFGIGSFACKVAAFRTTLESPTDPAVVTGTHAWLLQRDDANEWRICVVAWTIEGRQSRG